MIITTTTNTQQATPTHEKRQPTAVAFSTKGSNQHVVVEESKSSIVVANQPAQSTVAKSGSGPKTNKLDQAVVNKIADFAQSIQRDLQFSIDEKLGETVIKVVDSKTHEVIRQIPSKEALAIARHVREQGLLFNSKA